MTTARYTPEHIADALGQFPPTPEQREVIQAPLEPTLVVAGAGSGKTETMASRVVHLVANDLVAPEAVLGLTFTRKAALELGARVAGKLAQLREAGLWTPRSGEDVDGFDLPTISTYHAYAGRLVSEHGLRLGVEPDTQLLTEAASWQLAHEVVSGFEGDVDELRWAPSTLVKGVLHLSGELAEHLVEPQHAMEWLQDVHDTVTVLPGKDGRAPLVTVRDTAMLLRQQRRLYPMVQAYAAAKRARGVLDFADQMAIAARLARDVPAVRTAEQVRFEAVLLDEFQDTSEAQMVLLASLYAGRRAAVTAVGDPHQSIYGWRGASATTLARFPREFALDGRPAPVLPLSTSWRNERQVLAAANVVAAELQRLSAVPVATLSARPGAGDGRVEAARLPDHLAEASYVARWVRAQREGGAATAAVLCRTRAQFAPVVEALRAEGLPVEVVGLGGLLDTPEILDLVALLWVVQEPTRGDQLMRLLSGPACRLGAADLDALWAWARELAGDTGAVDEDGRPLRTTDLGSGHDPVLAEALDTPPETGWVGRDGQHLSQEATDRVRWLAAVVRRVRGLTGLPLPDLVGEAERSLGLDLEVASDPELHPTWGRAQLDALVDVAAGFASGADRADLGAFLDWLDAAREHERGLEAVEVPDLAEVAVDTRAVQVLTVHAAKGLEWDAVAVPGLVEGVFPSHSGVSQVKEDSWQTSRPKDKGWLGGVGRLPTELRGDREGRPTVGWKGLVDSHELRSALERVELEGGELAVREERRLAYVALTRARHRMLLTAPVWTTGVKPRVTSRFLEELLADPALGLATDVWAPMPDPTDPAQLVNPRSLEDQGAPWPREPDRRRTAVREVAAALVDAREASPRAGALSPVGAPAGSGAVADRSPWEDEIDLLLAERAEHRQRREQAPWPEHLSTSAVVSLVADPAAFRQQLRRPMPQPPAPHARLGTSFHAWVEQHFAAASLVDVDDLVDADEEEISEEALSALQDHFLRSEWASMTPLAIEVAVETEIAGRSIRGRLDAVFESGDGRRVVVDWKTGSPGSPERQRVRALQLAVYRLAYARLEGLDPDRVDAAFFYASTGRTVRPELPGEEDLVGMLDEILRAE